MKLHHAYLLHRNFRLSTLRSTHAWNFTMLEWRIVFSFTLSVFIFLFPFLPYLVNVWRSTTALYDDYLEE